MSRLNCTTNSNFPLKLLFLSREQLQRNAREGHFYLTISYENLVNFDEPLSQELRQQPSKVLPVFETAVRTVYRNNYMPKDQVGEVPHFQVQLSSDENYRMLRDLQSTLMGQMVVIPGIVTAASKTCVKATSITVKCSNCGHEKVMEMKTGFGGTMMPRQCDQVSNPGTDRQRCQLDPYKIVADKCQYMD